MTTVVQQIVYTAQPERWWALAEALGFVAPFPPEPVWGEFHADGALAVHRAFEDRAAGAVDIHILVDDLDSAAAALADFEVDRVVMDGVGELLTVHTSSGSAITVAAGAPMAPRRATAAIAVQPIWFEPALREPRRILEALGMRAGIVADRGGWVEMEADGGTVGLHEGERRVGLSFSARGDLDRLASRLTDAGFRASVVDEAFTRTVRVADPDGGEDVWINGVQDDLHGYHREV